MDYRIYRAVNGFVVRHEWLGDVAQTIETWAVPLIAVATVALWLLARPGGDRKWKLAASSALGAAALGLVVNQVIAKIWHRPRPYQSHPHVYHSSSSHDPSFPSDHASAAFAIAFAVLIFDRIAGALFLAAAVVVGVGRVFTGAHYPGDILAGCLVGLGAALVVARLGRPVILVLVRIVERATDPVVRPFWRARS